VEVKFGTEEGFPNNMTKKLLGGLFLSLLCAAVGSAAIVVDNPCSISGGSASGPGTPTVTGTATCNGFTLPANQTLLAVELFVQNDYQLGAGGGLNTIIYTYTVSNSNITGISSTVSGGGGSGSYTTISNIAACTFGVDAGGFPSNNTADCAGMGIVTGGVGPNHVGGSVSTIVLSGVGTWVSGSPGLQINGSEGFSISARFTYADLSAPEPASMLMVGGGLIALALAGRKKFRA